MAWARGGAVVMLVLGLFGASCADDAGAVDGARALERVKRQVAFGPRISGTPGNTAAREWIAAEAARLGGRVETQAFIDTIGGKPVPLANVIARFGPTTGRRIALYAHFDTRPWSDMATDPAEKALPVPGANDAGSGVAVLLEVAELMKQRAPKVGVDLVFLDGEDMGRPTEPDEYCRGSRGYALRLPLVGDDARPVAGFLFDMVGDKDLGIWDEGNSATRATNLVDLVHEAARATGARHFHEGIKYTLIDDHVPLLDAGLPAVDIIDFDYPAWHTPRDLPDQVSAESLAEVSRVAAWIVFKSSLAK
ncbi:MAG: M28 family peptidase [Candidatus Eisenbacteria bacterium]|nr:M28 family peptidase [Candidatus Eisenbacteria bacterium]